MANVFPQGIGSLLQNVPGASIFKLRQVSGTHAVFSQNDLIISFTSDSLRYLDLPDGAPPGTLIIAVDGSYGTNNQHPIIISAPNSLINNNTFTTITPGSSTVCCLISDGVNYLILFKY